MIKKYLNLIAAFSMLAIQSLSFADEVSTLANHNAEIQSGYFGNKLQHNLIDIPNQPSFISHTQKLSIVGNSSTGSGVSDFSSETSPGKSQGNGSSYDVDQTTNQLSASYSLASINANYGMGPVLSLSLNYSFNPDLYFPTNLNAAQFASAQNISAINPKGWSLDLPYIYKNQQGQWLISSSGQTGLIKEDLFSIIDPKSPNPTYKYLHILKNKQNDLSFSIYSTASQDSSNPDHVWKGAITITDSSGTVTTLGNPVPGFGYRVTKVVNAQGYALNFNYTDGYPGPSGVMNGVFRSNLASISDSSGNTLYSFLATKDSYGNLSKEIISSLSPSAKAGDKPSIATTITYLSNEYDTENDGVRRGDPIIVSIQSPMNKNTYYKYSLTPFVMVNYPRYFVLSEMDLPSGLVNKFTYPPQTPYELGPYVSRVVATPNSRNPVTGVVENSLEFDYTTNTNSTFPLVNYMYPGSDDDWANKHMATTTVGEVCYSCETGGYAIPGYDKSGFGAWVNGRFCYKAIRVQCQGTNPGGDIWLDNLGVAGDSSQHGFPYVRDAYYETSERSKFNGNSFIKIYKFNATHSLISEELRQEFSTESSILLNRTEYLYSDGLNTARNFDDLMTIYNKPVQVSVKSYSQSGLALLSSTPKVLTTKYQYNEFGDVTDKVNPNGSEVKTTYFPKNSMLNGFQRLVQQVITKPTNLAGTVTADGFEQNNTLAIGSGNGGQKFNYLSATSSGYLDNGLYTEMFNNSVGLVTNDDKFNGMISSHGLVGGNAYRNSDVTSQTVLSTFSLNDSAYPGYITTSGSQSGSGVNGLTTYLSGKSVNSYTGNLLYSIDQLGNKTSYEYDNDGVLIKTSFIPNSQDSYDQPNSVSYQYQINPNNDGVTYRIATSSINNKSVKTAYDSSGKIIAEYEQINGEWQPMNARDYNEAGVPIRDIQYNGPNGTKPMITTYVYDGIGTLIATQLPNGVITGTIYADIDGRSINYSISKDGRLITTVGVSDSDTLSGNMTNSYVLTADNPDFQNWQASILTSVVKSGNINQLGSTEVISAAIKGVNEAIQNKTYISMLHLDYDGYGREIKSTTLSKNKAGQFISNVSSVNYDVNGTIKNWIDGYGSIYSADINLLGQVMRARLTTSQSITYNLAQAQHNGAGQVVSSSSLKGLNGITQYSYNNIGQPVTVIKPDGTTISTQYDLLGRAVTVSVNNKLLSHISYDPLTGEVESTVTYMADGNISANSYKYTEDGEVAQYNSTLSNPNSLLKSVSYNYTYDPFLGLKTATDSLAPALSYEYDDLGRLISTSIDGVGVISYNYDSTTGLQNSTSAIYGANSMISNYKYNQIGQLLNTSSSYNNKLVESLSYAYIPNGKIDSIIDKRDIGSNTYNYGYDDKNGNLLNYACSGSFCPQDENGNPVLAQSFTYDNFGNIQSTTTNTSQQKSILSYKYAVNNLFQLISLSSAQQNYYPLVYDKNGELSQDWNGNQLTRDLSGNLIGVKTVTGLLSSYSYDGQGRQIIIKNSGTDPVYKMYGLSGAISDQNQGQQIINYLPGGYAVESVGGERDTHLQLTDHLGSSIQDVSLRGAAIENLTYLPYGLATKVTTPSVIKLGSLESTSYLGINYLGSWKDKVTGYNVLGAGYRQYDSSVGLMVGQDRSGPDISFSYGGGDPINHSDPTGHSFMDNNNTNSMTWNTPKKYHKPTQWDYFKGAVIYLAETYDMWGTLYKNNGNITATAKDTLHTIEYNTPVISDGVFMGVDRANGDMNGAQNHLVGFISGIASLGGGAEEEGEVEIAGATEVMERGNNDLSHTVYDISGRPTEAKIERFKENPPNDLTHSKINTRAKEDLLSNRIDKFYGDYSMLHSVEPELKLEGAVKIVDSLYPKGTKFDFLTLHAQENALGVLTLDENGLKQVIYTDSVYADDTVVKDMVEDFISDTTLLVPEDYSQKNETPLLLLGCSLGGGENCTAQQFSNYLNRPVISNSVAEPIRSHLQRSNGVYRYDYIPIDGKWKIYQPRPR